METWALIYKLQHSTPECVFAWLRSKESEQILSDDCELEASLIKRDDNLINLGLALYGQQTNTGLTLYKTGDETIRRAVLCGPTIVDSAGEEPWILSSHALIDLVSEWQEDYLESLLTNKHIPSHIILSVLRHNNHFESLSYENWMKLANYAIRNEGFSCGHIGGIFADFDEICRAAWCLSETLPVSKKSGLLLKLVSVCVPRPSYIDVDVMSVIGRWHSDSEKVLDDVRQILVGLVPTYSDDFERLKESSDLALRKGYYENKDFSFTSDMQVYYEKDGYDFLDAVTSNDSIYFPLGLRSEIGRLCEAHDRKYASHLVSYFTARFENLVLEKPRLFDFEEDYYPYYLLKDANSRMEMRLENSDKKLTAIHGLFRGSPESGSFYYQLFSRLDSILESLRSIRKLEYSWLAWAMFGVLIGYSIAKY